jgi:hypothetical protein
LRRCSPEARGCAMAPGFPLRCSINNAAGGRKRQGRWALWVLQGTLRAVGGRKRQGRWALFSLGTTIATTSAAHGIPPLLVCCMVSGCMVSAACCLLHVVLCMVSACMLSGCMVSAACCLLVCCMPPAHVRSIGCFDERPARLQERQELVLRPTHRLRRIRLRRVNQTKE